MMTVATPTSAALDQQAAKLRERAAGLNRQQADRQERVGIDTGARVDDAHRAAASARAAAATATTQADDMHGKAKENLDLARKFEDDAARMANDGSPFGRDMADDLREQAQLLRAAATSYSQRATRSEQVARQQLDIAERADREAFQVGRAGYDQSASLDAMRLTANQLESKATVLEQAADEMRLADTPWLQDQRTVHLGKVQELLTQADAIRPDFTKIEVSDIIGAGIPLSETPGNELMDPRLQTPAPAPGDIHDTDLMDPYSMADPVGDASGGEVAAVAVDDPIDPAGLPDSTPGDDPVNPWPGTTSEIAADDGMNAQLSPVGGTAPDLVGTLDGDLGAGPGNDPVSLAPSALEPATVPDATAADFSADSDGDAGGGYSSDAYGDASTDVAMEYGA